MTRTEMLAPLGRQFLIIEAVQSVDGVWRILFTAKCKRVLLLNVGAAAELAHELRLGGERLLATRIEIGIEQARRFACQKGPPDAVAPRPKAQEGCNL